MKGPAHFSTGFAFVKRLVVFLLLVAFAMPPSLAVAAEPPFSDKLCPAATQPVREYIVQTNDKGTPVDIVIATANRIIVIYKQCGTELQANGTTGNSYAAVSTNNGAEGLHYAQLHQAQYYVVIGRIQRFIGNTNSARDALQTAVDLAKETIEWKSPRQTTYRSNNVAVGSGSVSGAQTESSVYRDTAIKVRDDALAELAKLPKSVEPPK
jgi:hypothetical protein